MAVQALGSHSGPSDCRRAYPNYTRRKSLRQSANGSLTLASCGLVFSGTVLLELARRGVSREQAYEWVQRNAMRAFHEQRLFKDLLLADADVTKALSRDEIERAFDLDEQLKHVDFLFDRVFVQQEVHA